MQRLGRSVLVRAEVGGGAGSHRAYCSPISRYVARVNSLARRMFELIEPIGVIPYAADEPNEAMFALGFDNYWDTYFAGRAAPLGLASAAVVDAALLQLRSRRSRTPHPKGLDTTTPEAAIVARQAGCTQALRRILADHVDSPDFARAADLLTKAATSAPREGRPMYAALRALPIPDDVVARLFHASSLLREHRGDGHITALMVEVSAVSKPTCCSHST